MVALIVGDTVTTGSKAGRGLSAVECRALSWLSWARRVISSAAAPGKATKAAGDAAAGLAGDEFAEAAAGLAAAVPYQVSMQDVSIELQHAQVPASELAVAVNGAVVGLVCGGSNQQQHQQGLGGAAVLPECLGLGLVRAVDAQQQVLYLLTDVDEELLQHVDTLVVGRLELPDKLQATQHFASPYQGLFCITSTATGAGVIKSRNNLLRASLMRT